MIGFLSSFSVNSVPFRPFIADVDLACQCCTIFCEFSVQASILATFVIKSNPFINLISNWGVGPNVSFAMRYFGCRHFVIHDWFLKEIKKQVRQEFTYLVVMHYRYCNLKGFNMVLGHNTIQYNKVIDMSILTIRQYEAHFSLGEHGKWSNFLIANFCLL